VEHLTDTESFTKKTGITDNSKISLMIRYAESILSENLKYNLTGHKNLHDIIENLIIGSLEPLVPFNVPRGTLFADIGTGAGIPGVPLAIKYSESEGILLDSNQKKIRFINRNANELGIQNVKALNIRVEDAGRSIEFREKFDLVFTRAMSDIYTIAELGSPLLKKGGLILIYINKDQSDFSKYLQDHLSSLGLILESTASENNTANEFDGITLKKIKNSDDKFPRKMPVIKRMAIK